MEAVISDVHGDRKFECEEFQGHLVRHIKEADGKPRVTAAQTLFGSLWYANIKPTLIVSSPERFKGMLWAMKLDQIVPVVHTGEGYRLLGFFWNGAVWVPGELCGDRVYMLNKNYPDDPKYNGWCVPMAEG